MAVNDSRKRIGKQGHFFQGRRQLLDPGFRQAQTINRRCIEAIPRSCLQIASVLARQSWHRAAQPGSGLAQPEVSLFAGDESQFAASRPRLLGNAQGVFGEIVHHEESIRGQARRVNQIALRLPWGAFPEWRHTSSPPPSHTIGNDRRVGWPCGADQGDRGDPQDSFVTIRNSGKCEGRSLREHHHEFEGVSSSHHFPDQVEFGGRTSNLPREF